MSIPRARITFPFVAIVGQERLKKALILTVINPSLSGVLIRGEKGTAKSTAVRALAELLPDIEVIEGDPFHTDPRDRGHLPAELRQRLEPGEQLKTRRQPIRVVDLPVSATEDRVVGTLDLEHALRCGEKRIEPGILAAAHRGILYVDEVNLLDDHVVDVLLDAAAMGVNTIEREGISFWHPARFTLVGTMNPEEGELRPQLLDRFGLCVTVGGLNSRDDRVEVMCRRAAFDADPGGFCQRFVEQSQELTADIMRASELLPHVEAGDEVLRAIAERSLTTGVDGHRSDIIMLKAARTLAAYYGRSGVIGSDIEEAAELALAHRVRRRPFDALLGSLGSSGSGANR
ncbi:ATP-binding protein [Myxococcota bacterium]